MFRKLIMYLYAFSSLRTRTNYLREILLLGKTYVLSTEG